MISLSVCFLTLAPAFSEQVLQSRSWEVSSLGTVQGPGLQSTGAEADRCLLRARLEARAPSYPPFAKRPTRVTQTLIIPFLLLLTARYDLRRASPTSARAMERKRWTKSKNRKHSARHQETRAGRRKDFQPGSRFAHHHSPRTSSLGTRGGADSAEVSGAAPRAPPRKFEALPPSRRLRERPRSPRTRGQAVRTVPYLPERRGHVATLPAARQTTTVGGDTRPGSPRPAPPNRTAPPAPAATDRVKHGCPSLDASAAAQTILHSRERTNIVVDCSVIFVLPCS